MYDFCWSQIFGNTHLKSPLLHLGNSLWKRIGRNLYAHILYKIVLLRLYLIKAPSFWLAMTPKLCWNITTTRFENYVKTCEAHGGLKFELLIKCYQPCGQAVGTRPRLGHRVGLPRPSHSPCPWLGHRGSHINKNFI